jgi:hypothetical protein
MLAEAPPTLDDDHVNSARLLGARALCTRRHSELGLTTYRRAETFTIPGNISRNIPLFSIINPMQNVTKIVILPALHILHRFMRLGLCEQS